MNDEIEDVIKEDFPLTGLPSQTNNSLSNPNDFYRMAFEFQKIMMLYESAIKQIETKLEILNKESKVNHKRSPIETIKSRIKTPDSIAKKLEKRGIPVTFEAMIANLDDIAGVRVICPYISDIYAVQEMLLKQPDIKLIVEKDYIKHPKESGYRSLHLVIETPVYLSKTEHNIRVEIQLRTIAMDFWASLEHDLRYKCCKDIPEHISKEMYSVADEIAAIDRRMQHMNYEIQAL